MIRKSKKQQALDAQLGLIVDEMGSAIWNADKSHIAQQDDILYILTLNMRAALYKLLFYCKDNYGR